MHDENKVRATRLANGSWMDALLCVKGYEFQTKSTSASSTNERPATGRQLVDLSNFDMVRRHQILDFSFSPSLSLPHSLACD